MNERTLAWIAIIVAAVVYSVIEAKYTESSPPSARSFAITPIVFLSAFLGIVAAADGPGMAFIVGTVIVAIYVIGRIAEVCSPKNTR